MSWVIVDTGLAARSDVRIVKVDVPEFPDRIDYEGILGRAFDRPADRDFLASGGMVLLATENGFRRLRILAERSGMLRMQGMREELRKIGLDRQAAALRWEP